MYFLISCSWKLFLEKMSNTKKISTYAALLLFFSLQKIWVSKKMPNLRFFYKIRPEPSRPIKQCLKIPFWQCLSLSFEETWEINIAKKEFSNTVLWVWMVLAWFCRKNEDLASSCLPQWPEIQNYVQKFWALFSSYCSEIWLDLPITHIVDNNGKQ